MNRDIFVENIRILSRRRGELPTILCKKAGVGGSFVSDINRGRTPSIEKVQRLADYLGVTTSQLLGEDELPPVEPPKEDATAKKNSPTWAELIIAKINESNELENQTAHKNAGEPTVGNDGLSDGEQALLNLFRQLTPEQQDMVIRMVQAAADKL